eukprot:1358416-Amorphochlora_amoeboformis.AAC.2
MVPSFRANKPNTRVHRHRPSDVSVHVGARQVNAERRTGLKGATVFLTQNQSENTLKMGK